METVWASLYLWTHFCCCRVYPIILPNTSVFLMQQCAQAAEHNLSSSLHSFVHHISKKISTAFDLQYFIKSVGMGVCFCVRVSVSPEFISFQSWSTRASLHRAESVVLVKGGFLQSKPRILCLIGQETQTSKQTKKMKIHSDILLL